MYQLVSLPVLLGSTLNHISYIYWSTINSLFSSSNFASLDERKHSLQRDWLALFSYIFSIEKKKSQSPLIIELHAAWVTIPFLREKGGGQHPRLHFHHLSCCLIACIMINAGKVKPPNQFTLNKNQVLPGHLRKET